MPKPDWHDARDLDQVRIKLQCVELATRSAPVGEIVQTAEAIYDFVTELRVFPVGPEIPEGPVG